MGVPPPGQSELVPVLLHKVVFSGRLMLLFVPIVAYTTYATIGTNNNINRPLKTTLCNNTGTNSDCPGGGTPIAQTTITYDGYGSNGALPLNLNTRVINQDT